MGIDYRTDIDPAYGDVVELSPLIRRVVCKNPGRFTFKGTGTYIVGRGEVAVIDPGPKDEDHIAALLAAVAGEEVTHIVITHTHGDHSPGAGPLQTATGAKTYGFGPHPVVPPEAAAAFTPTTWKTLEPTPEELEELKASMPKKATKEGHAEQEEPSDVNFAPDVELAHGETIEGGNWTLEGVYTPGHISNHMCFGLREESALFTGDHIMGWSTTVVPPPDGSMADYMASLELVQKREGDRVYYPTHGPPIDLPGEFVASLIQHRLDREQQILTCLASGPKTIPEMVTAMYTDTTPHILHMAAGQSVLSQLVWLVEKQAVAASSTALADATYSLP